MSSSVLNFAVSVTRRSCTCAVADGRTGALNPAGTLLSSQPAKRTAATRSTLLNIRNKFILNWSHFRTNLQKFLGF